jgi:pimeloyl-ACP methyl ester carboxylesterase
MAAKKEYLDFYDHQAEHWPVPSASRFVDTSFGRTFVRVQGPIDGEPLVLLPGDTETSLSWLPVVTEFSQTFRTFAIDHVYDNGRSVYTRKMSRPSDFVNWLDQVFDKLELEALNLVGYSYGAWQSALYALSHASRVKKLVLIAPSSTVLSPSPTMLLRAILYYVLPFRFVTKSYFYWYGPEAIKRDRTRSRVDEMIEEDLLARRCFKRRSFVAPTRLTDQQWKRLQTPTLFLIGDQDRTYSVERAVGRLRLVAPMVESDIAPNTDHYALLVSPGWVSKKAIRFLQK